MIRLLLVLLLLPCSALAQVFPYEVKDPATNRNLHFLWENVLKLKKVTGSSGSFILTSSEFGGDVSGTYDNLAVIDNSHLHNMTSLQGVLSDTTTVPPSLINLSTVTTALAGKLSNTETVPISLIDLSTVTTALAGKLSLSGGTMTGGLTSESWANFTSSVTASAFYGDGSNLTGISTVGGAGVLQLDDYGNLLPDDIVTLDSFLEVVGNDIIPLEAS